MANGGRTHTSPQYTKFPKRKKSQKKMEKLVAQNVEILRKFKN